MPRTPLVAVLASDRRIAIVSSLALVFTATAVVLGGIPFALIIAIVILLVLMAFPASPRRYLARRLVGVLGSVGVSMALVWLLVHNYRDDARLDETGLIPAMARYVEWIGDLVSGDMGSSQYSETVSEGIARSLPISLQLVAYSQVIALLIAIPGALLGAQMRGKLGDVAARGLSLLGLSLPVFVSGPLLAQLFGLGDLNLFGYRLGWKVLPVARYVPMGDGLVAHLRSMALPSITLAISTAAIYLVLLRSELIQQLQSPHALLARAKGLSPARIVRVHGLRPASPSTVAAVAAQSGFILGNVIIIERVFILPGFGDYTLIAIGRRDVVAVAGSLFVAAIVLAIINLVAEALLLVLDPRLDR